MAYAENSIWQSKLSRLRSSAQAVNASQDGEIEGREVELESDKLGVRFMSEAGYDLRSMLRVMEVLEKAGSGRGGRPEFASTHPNPGRRMDRIREAIQAQFPNGVPAGLER